MEFQMASIEHPASSSDLQRAAESRLQQFVNSIQDYAIIMLTPSGCVSRWNAGAQTIKGYSPDEIIGRHISVFYPPEDVAAGKPERELTIAAAQGRIEDKGWRVRRDGSRFWADVIITAVRDASGELSGFAKITREVAEQPRCSGERDVLATTGHEIRNAAAPLALVGQLLRKLYAQDAQLANYARMLLRQSEVFADLASRLASPVKASHAGNTAVAARNQQSRGPVNVCELVKHSLEVAQANVPQHDPVNVETPGIPLWIEGDFGRLSQAFVNLTINALKYSSPTGRVAITVAQAGHQCYVKVKDDGIGIPPDDLGRIFTLYERSDASRLSAQDGQGVGLTVTKEIVLEHGGAIYAASEGRDRGAEFTVRLPLGCPPSKASADIDDRSARVDSGFCASASPSSADATGRTGGQTTADWYPPRYAARSSARARAATS
jgi:PAS domain S-box-containing protein